MILIEFVSKINLSERLRRPPLLKRRGLNLKIDFRDARGSVLDSFFTSPAIIDGIYEALEKFGFEGGNLLEKAVA